MRQRSVIVVGGGMGGLAAAATLARAGVAVTLLEARDSVGGLASGEVHEGLTFDLGPYVLLDRPGLEWTFEQLAEDLDAQVRLRKLEAVYQVEAEGVDPVRIDANLARTAAAMEAQWAGSGAAYREFVGDTGARYGRLQPMQRVSRPKPFDLLRSGGWRDVPFLLKPLAAILEATELPPPILQALGIWTHVAGQPMAEAPSPLAFVPSLIHGPGAWYALDGVASIPRAIAAIATAAGATLRTGARVARIDAANGQAQAVILDTGERLVADAVVANAAGLAVYLDPLLEPPPAESARAELAALPLQSPGVCAYLAVPPVKPGSPYLRFRLPGDDGLCRLLILPGAVDPEVTRDGWQPARLLAPMRHAEATAMGPAGQRAFLEGLLAEPWIRQHIGEFRVLSTRTPADWGQQFNLHRESMNPVMTAAFMRAGRLAHRSPHARGLYLAGSSTHPGQWISFCAVSGILAARHLLKDLR